MRKKQIIFIASVFLLILTSVHMAWNFYFMKSNMPLAKEGVLDLRSLNLQEEGKILLNGEWDFFPGQFIKPDDMNSISSRAEKTSITVPGNWGHSLSNNKNSSIGYGTYRLKILLNDEQSQSNRLYFTSIQTAATVYINGKVVEKIGQPSKNEANSIPENIPFFILVDKGVTEIDLVIHVSNFEGQVGGIDKPILLGADKTIIKEQAITYSFQYMAAIVLLFHSVYVLIIYFLFFGKKEKLYLDSTFRRSEFLYLAATFFCMSLATVVDNSKILLYLFPFITYEWWAKILLSSYTASVLFLVNYLKYFLPTFNRLRITSGYITLCIMYLLAIIFLPLHKTQTSYYVLLFILIFPVVMVSIIIFRMVSTGQRGAIYLFLAIISIGSSIVWGGIKNIYNLETPYYPFDLIIGVICFATYWFKQFYYVTKDSQEYAEKLQRMDKQKDDFLANTSHELRNPLHGIINIAQTLVDNEKNHLNEESMKNLHLLISVGQRMSSMLNDLLDVTRLKEGKIQLQTSSVHVASIVTGVFDMLHFMKEGKNIKFILDISENYPNVKADEHRLIQILFNLIHNAVKYSNKGKIIVSAEKQNGIAMIHVKDSGIGIDQQILNTLFQPYEQGDSGMTSMGGGIGLGLSICKHLVELHGGTIFVQSVVNEGSTFTFTVPLANDVVTEEHVLPTIKEVAVGKVDSEPQHHLGLERSRILIVDDDAVNVTIFKQILVMEQYDVVTCISGKEALGILNKVQFDLVISDVMMPNMSGYELTRKIRERFSILELPILLLTARSQPEDVQAGFDSGANDYVTKPVEKTVFLARVRALTTIKKSINEKVRIEAAWLQAQIQPHFLFNTLNTIAALSEINPTKMLDLLHEFGNYLRASFDTRNLDKVVPLEIELELVRSYLFIEQQRFDDRLIVEWKVDEGQSVQVQVPPLSIQTIVENAVKHGVLKRPEGGKVKIQVKEQLDGVQIKITDNGVGMSEEKIKQLLSEHTNQMQGIGIPNTDKRLKQLYGQGLMITSTLNKGTAVSFIIPKE